MENLKILESKLAERSRREEELKSELKEVQDEINVLEVEIARIRGTPEELNDIRKESENFTKDKKKRLRPNYKENFNKEHEERTTKRQKRNKISSEIIQDKEMEDTSESEMDTIEERLNILLEEYQKEKTAINKIIEQIIGGGINHDRRNIIRKSEKARKIYRIISVDGGKEKIRRLKFLNSEDYMKFNFGEIEEWI